MEIRYPLTAEDFRIFHAQAHTGGGIPYSGIPVGILFGLGLIAPKHDDLPDWGVAALFLTALLMAVAQLARMWWWRSGRAGQWWERCAGEYGVTLSSAGLVMATPEDAVFLAWRDLRMVWETDGYWYLLFRGSRTPCIVPKAALGEDGAEQFAAMLRCRRDAQEQSDAARRQGLARRLWNQVLCGYRLASFLACRARDFETDGLVLAGLFGCHLLLLLVSEYLFSLPVPVFSVYGLADYATYLVLFLGGGLAVSLAAGQGREALRLLTALAAASLAISLIFNATYLAFHQFGDIHRDHLLWIVFICWSLWGVAVAFRAAYVVLRLPAATAWLVAGIFILFTRLIPLYLPDQRLFYPEREDGGDGAEHAVRLDAEEIFYRQPRLIAEAVQSLEAGRRGSVDLYFIGFAGEADEPVFANEVDYVRKLFDRRFHTEGRSLALVNSPDTWTRLPVANLHNLETALQGVAERMDGGEDVLFLYLTSHGSKDHQLSVQFEPMPFNDVPADKLKEVLDRSGIRNRVIVVSACYSGGFVDVLKDEHSLVISAASRDRTSFGCGVESKFTYFGQAYFIDSLTQTFSFADAFEQARRRVEQRERDEDITASEPQIHLGEALAPKLRELEAGLARAH